MGCVISSLLFSCSVMSDSLGPHGQQHARLPCPSVSPGVCSNSCALSQWCHPNISSSVTPFSSCPQSFPASGSFPMSQLFTSGGQRIGALASVFAMNIQGLFPLGLTGLISLQSKGLWRVFSSTIVQKHQFFSVQFSSFAQSCLTLCDPMDYSMPGLPVHYQLPEFTQTHVHWVGDAMQPSHPLLSPTSHASIFHSVRVFPMSWPFASGGQSTGVSASTSFLPTNIQDCVPLGWIGLISLLSKGLSKVFSNTTVQKHQFFSALLQNSAHS